MKLSLGVLKSRRCTTPFILAIAWLLALGYATTPPGTAAPAVPDFAMLEQKAATAQYKVTYDMSFKSGGVQGNVIRRTVFVAGSKLRIDDEGTSPLNAAPISGTRIKVEGKAYMCMQRCTNLPIPVPWHDARSARVAGTKVEPKGTRDLLGITTFCYEIKAGESSGFGKDDLALTCYSPDGVMLASSTKSRDTEGEVIATSLTLSVSDDDFRLPKEILEFGGQPFPSAP